MKQVVVVVVVVEIEVLSLVISDVFALDVHST